MVISLANGDGAAWRAHPEAQRGKQWQLFWFGINVLMPFLKL